MAIAPRELRPSRLAKRALQIERSIKPPVALTTKMPHRVRTREGKILAGIGEIYWVRRYTDT
jgi:hypothetical protein